MVDPPDGEIEIALGALDVLSPELVMVLPPELAAEARRLVPDPLPFVRVPVVTPSRRAVSLFYVTCLAGTVGPLLLAYAAR